MRVGSQDSAWQFRVVVIIFFIMATISSAWAQGTIKGKISDNGGGSAISGARISVLQTGSTKPITGTTSKRGGTYEITLSAGNYDLLVQFFGYGEKRVPVALAQGETKTVDIGLDLTEFSLDELIVSASRKPEKAVDAPASITSVSARKLEQDVTLSPEQSLRNVPGVDISSAGADRSQIAVRGFNQPFIGSTLVLMDYRRAALSSLGVNAFNLLPPSIDIQSIEVIRGPAASMYGTGADNGVIHFVSKDPFTSQGTTISLGGGERTMLQGALRHAGTIGDKFGYKIVASGSRVNDWQLDPTNRFDSLELSRYLGFSNRPTASQAERLQDAQNQRVYDTWKYNLLGMAKYKFTEETSIALTTSWSAATFPILSNTGTNQADNFGVGFAQLRFESGKFFTQAYINQNSQGNSFIYGTGAPIIDRSTLLNAQAQYGLDFGEKQNFIVGLDYQLQTPITNREGETIGTVHGRNELNDAVAEFGGYVQSETRITDKLIGTVGLRLDYNSALKVDNLQFSPRAALVYKVDGENSLRATYNRAFASPSPLFMFLDLVAQRPTLPIIGQFTIRGTGAQNGYSFAGTPGNRTMTSTGLLPSLPMGQTASTQNFALQYLDVYRALISAATASGALAPLRNVLLGVGVQGSHPTQLEYLNAAGRAISDVAPVEPLRPTITNTYEIGYKGLLGGKLVVGIDAYYTVRENFIGPLEFITPSVVAQGFGTAGGINAFTTAMVTAMAQNPTVIGALRQALNIPAAVPAATVAQQFASQLINAQTLPLIGAFGQLPLGIVQTNEYGITGAGNRPEFQLAYRNFGRVAFWGVDWGLEYMATDKISMFFNGSYMSDNFFTNDELNEANPALTLSMNSPQLRFRFGVDYSDPKGLTANLAARYQDGFRVQSGVYDGQIDAFTLVDLGVGYHLDAYMQGLRVDMSIQNVLNNVRREFIGAPALGRMGMVRFTYSF
jgi:outer membrane receptor for ferrienterochelin and colicins